MTEVLQLIRLALVFSTLALAAGSAQAQSTRVVPVPLLTSILANPLPAATAGDVRGDVTIVEYFDYDCPVCRHLEPELRKLLASDAKVRLIRKDWPVFGEASEYAAFCSYAAAREGRYAAAHDALILSHQDLDSKTDVQSVLRAAGFNMQQLDADIQSHAEEYSDRLKRSRGETAALGLQGTPGLIIGDEMVLGGVDSAGLVKLVRSARRANQKEHELTSNKSLALARLRPDQPD
jgi:protein-disulfide isomerase